MRFYPFILFIFFSRAAFASSITASYINNAQTLSVRIADNPATPPFEAGKLWEMMNSHDQKKVIEYPGIQIHCEATRPSERTNAFGSCHLLISTAKLTTFSDAVTYHLEGVEAESMNTFFSNSPLNVSLQFNKDSRRKAIILDIGRRLNNFSLSVFKAIIDN